MAAGASLRQQPQQVAMQEGTPRDNVLTNHLQLFLSEGRIPLGSLEGLESCASARDEVDVDYP